MRIQDAVLDALEKNRGEYLSGEQLASSLGVSRNAVWKAIQKLEEAGHKIRAVPKRGYTLAPESDVLTVQSVSRFLDTDMPVYLQVQTEVTSTNTLLKAQAEQGAPEGTVLIAESQTAGKGRLGRHFTSPPGTGIYFSLLLRPHCTAEKSLFITTTAAVAVCEAIEQVTGLNPQIKWVNDVYLNEKKVCGILTEASVDFENGGLNWAVLGIGINIAVPEEGFPEEIRSIAGAIFDGPCPVEMRSRISAAVIRTSARTRSSNRTAAIRFSPAAPSRSRSGRRRTAVSSPVSATKRTCSSVSIAERSARFPQARCRSTRALQTRKPNKLLSVPYSEMNRGK